MIPQQSVSIADNLAKLQSIIDVFNRDNLPIVIFSDTNCRSHLSGESDDANITGNRGELLLELTLKI